MINLVVVDDSAVLGSALQERLQTALDICVIGTAPDSYEELVWLGYAKEAIK